jgi:hypothetical protein
MFRFLKSGRLRTGITRDAGISVISCRVARRRGPADVAYPAPEYRYAGFGTLGLKSLCTLAVSD